MEDMMQGDIRVKLATISRLINLKDTRRNGQSSKSQLTKKSTCQKKSTNEKHQTSHFGYFMLRLTFWQVDFLAS
jgi:hypothetical protein